MTQHTHILTGATGFVGAALTASLLQQCPDELAVIVRPTAQKSAGERFWEAFSTAAQAYQLHPSVLSMAKARCRVLEGDVLKERCGISELEGRRIAQFWHCAASLRYEERYQKEIHETNVTGTQNALALARRLEAERFNYISTAYVAGRRAGLIEERRYQEAETNNCYERSKIEAERLVAASGLFARILRPSIVIGHSQTLAATNFSGFYGFIRQTVQFRGVIERTQPGLLSNTPLRLCINHGLGLNLIPVDFIARQAADLGLSNAPEGVYHLTHPAPPPVREVIEIIFREVGLPKPLLLEDKHTFSWLDHKFDERLNFYGSYITGNKHFDRRRTDQALTHPAEDLRFDDRLISAYVRWYLERLEQERVNLPAQR